MFKRWGLLLVLTLFVFSACAEIVGESNDGGNAVAEETPPSANEQSFEDYQKARQLEMQEMMQQRMMRGGVQNNRPISIGPGSN